MKPINVVFLMGAAAIGGGLVVRYTDHPVQIAHARSVPPVVVAPPVPPSAHMGPSTSVPVRSATRPAAATMPAPPPAPVKPSALSLPVHIGKQERLPANPAPVPTIVARTRIPAEPPAVVPLEHSTVPPPDPAFLPAPVPVPEAKETAAAPPPAPQPPPQPQAPPNHVTLRPGMLIPVRIMETLSSEHSAQGDVFIGKLDRPLIADGFVIAERGARVRGEVIDAKRGQLTIELREINTSDGQQVQIITQPWRKQGSWSSAAIKAETSIPFRLDQTVELTEKK